MYQPPQESKTLLDDSPAEPTMTAEEKRNRDSGSFFMSHFKSHSQAAPFSYEYVLEDGRLPFLSEIHPIKRKDLPSIFGMPALPPLTIPDEMKQDASSKSKDRHLHFDLPLPVVQAESTTDKMKRALSLGGSKAGHLRSVSHQLPQRAKTEPRRQQTPVTQPPPLVAPKLVLPTPSPSPELLPIPHFRNSGASSFKSGSKNTGTRSSWTSMEEEEDRYDLALLQEAAMGRLDPSPMPTPTYEFRRDKAFALLGITDMPLTPPYTPAVSVAPSVSDYHSRLNSRRTSVEHQRLSHYSYGKRESGTSPKFEKREPVSSSTPPVTPNEKDGKMEEDLLKTPRPPQRSDKRAAIFVQTDFPHNIPLPPTPDEDIEMTPKVPPKSQARQVPTDIASPMSPRPTLKRKQSKFIEHLETTPELVVVSPSPNRVVAPMVLASERALASPRTAAGPPPPPKDNNIISSPTSAAADPAAHITTAEPLNVSLPETLPPSFPVAWPLTLPSAPAPPSPRKQTSVPIIVEPKSAVDDVDAITPCDVQYPAHLMPRRSMSMRESTRKSWGAIVCTAEARPIVAMGSAKLISS